MKENSYFIEKLSRVMGNYVGVRNLLREIMQHIIKEGGASGVFIYRKSKDKLLLWEKKGKVDLPISFK